MPSHGTIGKVSGLDGPNLRSALRLWVNSLSRGLPEVIPVLDLDGFIRVKQAAALLGVSPNTIRAWGADGRIPEYRHPVNNYRLFKRTDLERILKRLERPVSPTRRRERQGRSR